MSVHALAQHFDLYLCVTMQKLLPDALVIEKKKNQTLEVAHLK